MLKIRPIMIVALLFLLVSMLLNPSAAASAAAHGLSLWWQIIAPSLLPFFISFELLLNLGLGNVLGRLLEPIMRPVFALPGTAALGVAMGFCAGFPTGAAIAAALRNQGEITAAEGERLIAFTNNASPLYLSVGVAAGILHCPQAALLLMAVQYLGNIALGITLSLLPGARKKVAHPTKTILPPPCHPPSFGLLLKNAALKSAQNIALIGCYMAFFSVLTTMLCQLPLLQQLIAASPPAGAFLAGFWEMSLGINALANLSPAQAIPWAAMLLAWGGISVQAQVAAMVAGTGIRLRFYLLCRLLHSVFSYFAAREGLKLLSLPATTLTLLPTCPSPMLFSCRLLLILLLILPLIGGLLAQRNSV